MLIKRISSKAPKSQVINAEHHASKQKKQELQCTAIVRNVIFLSFALFLVVDVMMLFVWSEIISNSSDHTNSSKPMISLHHQVKTVPVVLTVSKNTSILLTNSLPIQPQPGKERVWRTLLEAGVAESTLRQYHDQLPTWDQVTEQYGNQPILLGLESCKIFRRSVPAIRRMLGAAGLFSTGTNLVTALLKQNCYIPERLIMYGESATKEQLGMRWQVQWGKHTPQHYRRLHATPTAAQYPKNDLLPIITIRHPWRWMQSMCKNPYAARWPHHSQCPNLWEYNEDRSSRTWNKVSIEYKAGIEVYQSLAHVWGDWYRDYHRASILLAANEKENTTEHFPWLMIRMEDLVFHTQDTIQQVCKCAGGRMHDIFTYVRDSAKADSPGHDTSTGMAEAWIKYGRPLQAMAGFAEDDYEGALEALDNELMNVFHYHHPQSASGLRT